MAVVGAAGMLWDLAANGRSKDAKITEYQMTLLARLQEIFPAGVPQLPKAGARTWANSSLKRNTSDVIDSDA
jgi:hypothetical protein